MPGWLGLATGAVGVVGGIVGGDKDPERYRKADELAARAINGDDAALRQLDCLSGSQTYAAEFNALQPPGCGFATDSARAYAKTKLAEVKARRGVAVVTGNAAVGAAAVGTAASPSLFTQTVTRQIPALAGVPSIVLIGGVAFVAYLLLKGK